MATLNGFIRSTGAAIRRMEREQQRVNREALKRFKEQQKQLALEDAQKAYVTWTNYVDLLQSVHKDCSRPIDWPEIRSQTKPVEPTINNDRELSARNILNRYKPNIIDKLFGLTKRKIKKLEQNVEAAIKNDKIETEGAAKKYRVELREWEELQKIAKGIEAQDPESYRSAIKYFSPFDDIKALGLEVSFSFSKTLINVDLEINSQDVIPDYELSLTSTVKLSRKNMPKSRFHELYQDHVCSCVLRVAREVFAYLPLEYARVNAISGLLNTKTGHIENKPILSVIIPPDTLMSLNFQTIDPSNSMDNFVHNMNFKKVSGFSEVEKVDLYQE